MLSGLATYGFFDVCKPATHLQLSVLDASSASISFLKKKSAPSCHGRFNVKTQILAYHILVWLCRYPVSFNWTVQSSKHSIPVLAEIAFS